MTSFTLNRVVECFIVDIFVAIDVLERNTSDVFGSDELVGSEFMFSLVTRQFETIGEAMNNLLHSSYGESAPCEWRKVVDFRNVIAHAYFGLNQDDLFYILKTSIPQLKIELVQFVKKRVSSEKLEKAIKHVKCDMRQYNRDESLEFLEETLRDLF